MSKVTDTQQHLKVEISVKNFGPIAKANIDLRPLTVFVGPSNTGKTYFATLVYALHSIFVGSFYTPEPIKKNISHQLSSHHDAVELAFKRYSEVLAGKIIVTTSQGGYPKYNYCPEGSEQEVSLTRTAAMVSELAPLVLYLRGLVKPGDILIIEEPEAHLHPGAQADLAVILARLVRAGVRVIITTHSDWLLEEIGNLILEGLLEEKTDDPASWLLPEEVGAWHFQKDKSVTEIAFHPRKGFSPEDYQDVAEGLYNRSVNLQQKFEKQEGKNEHESA